MPTINIEVSETGETTVAVQGCPGPTCKQLTAAIERAIGSTTSDRTTPEMVQPTQTAKKQGQAG